MEKIIFFDTETTGLPKNWGGSVTDVDNWPRVIQFAWQMADFKTGELLRDESILIKPDGWEVPSVKMFMSNGLSEKAAIKAASFWTDHGFTQEQNIAEGKDMDWVLDFFINDIEESQMVVAHNISFDHPITGAEMIRYGKRSENRPEKFCTMKSTTSICKIPNANGRGYKWPQLQELYYIYSKNSLKGRTMPAAMLQPAGNAFSNY